MKDAHGDGPGPIHTEQALLGALLVSNAALDGLPPLAGRHFADPVHGYLYDLMAARIRAGRAATPSTLAAQVNDHAGAAELGGASYLATLMGSAISVTAAPAFAREILTDHARRRVAELAYAAGRAAEEGGDPAEVMSQLESALAEVADDGAAGDPLQSFAGAMNAALEQANGAYMADGGLIPGAVPTGIAELDEALGGLHAGDLVVLGGRPSMGKSAVAGSIALAAARAGKGVLFASLEMDPAQVALRSLSEATALAGVRAPYRDLRMGRVTPDQFRAVVETAQGMDRLPMLLTRPDVRGVDQLASAARRAKARLERAGTPLGLVVFDYIQLADAPGQRSIDKVTATTRALKRMAQTLGVPVLAMSQLSRGVESRDDKRPMLSDLRESGSIEQDADVVLFCYREEYYLERAEPTGGADYDQRLMEWGSAMDRARGRLDLIVAKQRMGALPTVTTRFDGAVNRVGG